MLGPHHRIYAPYVLVNQSGLELWYKQYRRIARDGSVSGGHGTGTTSTGRTAAGDQSTADAGRASTAVLPPPTIAITEAEPSDLTKDDDDVLEDDSDMGVAQDGAASLAPPSSMGTGTKAGEGGWRLF